MGSEKTENKRMVPLIRFKGFTDAWEQRKLASLTSKIGSGKTPKGGNATYTDLGVPLLRSQNIHDDKVDFLGVAYISSKTDLEMKNSRVNKYDVLLNITGASIGRSAVYLQTFHANVNQHVCIIRPLTSMNAKLIQMQLASPSGQNQVQSSQTGGGREGLNFQQVGKFSISLPQSETEKTKTEKLLQAIYQTVALHQRKLDLLQKMKKGYLQKLFPKNGEKAPEMRFAGFTDAWEQRKFLDTLDDIVDFRGRTPKKLGLEWSDSGHLALSALNVKNGYIDSNVDPHYGDDVLYKRWMGGKELHQGQVLFTMEAPAGNVAQIPDEKGYILSQRTVSFVPKASIMTNDFLAGLLSSPVTQARIIQLATGGTAQGISQRSLRLLTVTYPTSIREQTLISSSVRVLSKTIALHQRKLEQLKKIKQALLQKMFV